MTTTARQLPDGLSIGCRVELYLDPRIQILDDLDVASEFVGETGKLVELCDDGKLGILIVSSGRTIRINANFVRRAEAGPDDEDDDNNVGVDIDIDVLLAPETDPVELKAKLDEALASKGHCVLRLPPSFNDDNDNDDDGGPQDALRSLLEAEESLGAFSRLPQEVEGGYLGYGCRAKVFWLDPWDPPFPLEGCISRTEHQLGAVAEVLCSSSFEDIDLLATVADNDDDGHQDGLGQASHERTPTLVCLSMTDLEELDYESRSATDKELEDFYVCWRRTELRALAFIGPAGCCARLTARTDSALRSSDGFKDQYDLQVDPGTILVFREDCYRYSFEEPPNGEKLIWLSTHIMRPMPQLSFGAGALEGDLQVFEAARTGPAPPTEDLVSVCALSIQACGSMYHHDSEWAAYAIGVDGQLEMPLSRFDYMPYYSEDTENPIGTTFVKHFSVQEGVELFDNKTFEISNMESQAMDPMCRQVLEVGYLAVHQIGLTKKKANTSPTHASVSVGLDKQEWREMPDVPKSVATNNQLAIVANRFNFIFNLKGGSYVMDTACSSSLCATHLGKVNLLERRWDPLEWHLGMGTGLTLTVWSFVHGSAAHMLSPGGRCFTFNATANGYNRGDGTAALLLKAGSQDEERWCYFRGSQIGQDGRSASMSAPNGPAQEKCVWGALREARMTPQESTIWECHGTGTALGDPIEVGAVRKVQQKGPRRSEPLLVVSSKSNMGHLEGSAAALSMNKCVLSVMNTICAPTQHLDVLNPHLDYTDFEAVFCSEAVQKFTTAGHCQVSSFGVGGTNGHAIFWGERLAPKMDPKEKFMEKLLRAVPPIIAIGPNPEDWEYSGPPLAMKPGEQCRVIYVKDPVTGDEQVRFECIPAAPHDEAGNSDDDKGSRAEDVAPNEGGGVRLPDEVGDGGE